MTLLEKCIEKYQEEFSCSYEYAKYMCEGPLAIDAVLLDEGEDYIFENWYDLIWPDPDYTDQEYDEDVEEWMESYDAGYQFNFFEPLDAEEEKPNLKEFRNAMIETYEGRAMSHIEHMTRLIEKFPQYNTAWWGDRLRGMRSQLKRSKVLFYNNETGLTVPTPKMQLECV